MSLKINLSFVLHRTDHRCPEMLNFVVLAKCRKHSQCSATETWPPLETRDVRDAHKTREALEANVHQCHHQQAELRLTLMQTRIRLAEVMATLRRISDAMQFR